MTTYDVLSSLSPNLHHFSRYLRLIGHYQGNVSSSDYVERHHIVPRSLGGTNESSNLVDLPTRAHYIAHMMLWKAFPTCNPMVFAAHMMRSRSNKSSKAFESLAKSHAIACSIRTTGKRHTDKTKQQMSTTAKSIDHHWLRTDENRERSTLRATTLLQSDEIVSKRRATLKAKGADHASKRPEVKRKIGRINQKLKLDAVSPKGELFADILISEFCIAHGITKHVIRKFCDQGPIPPVTNPGLLARMLKGGPDDQQRLNAIGWTFTSIPSV